MGRIGRRVTGALVLSLGALFAAGCHGAPATIAPRPAASTALDTLAPKALAYAQAQLRRTADALDPQGGFPQHTDADGNWIRSNRQGWTSGFFAGELWYMYELTRDPYWRTQAGRWTAPLEDDKTMTTTHDLGFMIFDSFGQEYRLTRDPHAKDVILEAAAHLAGRFNPAVGATKSWDSRGPHGTWKFPVIVDNLMNLELLFWAADHGGNPEWWRMAERHAETSLRRHLRPNGSTGHVALFDATTGAFEGLVTAQGYADTSVWARGQAWAIYGFTNAYRNTQRREFLDGAQRAADWFVAHLPADGVPYWDFDAPGMPNTERDASAAAIAASGLLELATYTRGAGAARYRDAAVHILTSLCTRYTTEGTHSAVILAHSVGSRPANSQVDVGIVYADYYYIEALMRYLGATQA